MNTIGMALVWCMIQVTLVAAASALAYAFVRRYGPPARAHAALAGLMLTAGLTAATFSPWPRWNLVWRSESAPAAHLKADKSAGAAPGVTAATLNAAAELDPDPDPEPAPAGPPGSRPEIAVSPATIFFKTLFEEMQRQPVRERTTWHWPAYLAVVFLAGLGIGIIRLVLGLAAVRSYRLRAGPISDPRLQETADVLLAELRGPKSVSVCESSLLSTPATVGWRKPLIILPADWPEWSAEECRVVLAHEIAHVARHDYATWIAAQLALVCHFYHPLVHWLAGRLRLEQELAADAAAAQVAGGQQTYLMTLAGMALRRSDRALAWPARTFLPTRGTLMRRIEMLRDEKLHVHEVTARFRAVLIAGLAIVGVGAAGLRGRAAEPESPAKPSPVLAAADEQPNPAGGTKPVKPATSPQAPAPATSPAAAASSTTASAAGTNSSTSGSSTPDVKTIGAVDPDSLAWVPRDAVAVVRLRPRDLLNRPALGALKKSLLANKELIAHIGVPFDRFEQVTTVFFLTERPGVPIDEPAAMVLRVAAAADATALLKALHPQGEVLEFSGQKYLRGGEGRPWGASFRADERTIVFCRREEYLRRVVVAGKRGAAKAKWAEAWKQTPAADAVGLLNPSGMRSHLDIEFGQASISPLWRECSTAILTADISDQISLHLDLTAADYFSGTKVLNSLSAVMTFTQTSLSQMRAQSSQLPGEQGAMRLRIADLIDSILDTVKFSQYAAHVRATAAIDAEQTAAIAAALAPAFETARGAAGQGVSVNNLKQLGLAMFNYQTDHKSFPPAVLYGPDGKTPYSWRVALLPYLDQAALYKQYDQNEPWDGPHNKLLIDKMPAVFRDPIDGEKSHASSYFALTGLATVGSGKGETVFSRKDGTKLPEIPDGTSYTLMLVEARREFPWTKPEDIPFDPDLPFPKLKGRHGNLFLALFADGAVRILPMPMPEQLLKALATRNGGEPIDFDDPAFRTPPPGR